MPAQMRSKLKLASIVGARPQFIKMAAISRAILRHNQATAAEDLPVLEHTIVHTGQHYDDNMSALFFEQLEIPSPDYNLNVGSDTHARQTAHMLIGLEEVLGRNRPDFVILYGDTNSTLAGAIAASKLRFEEQSPGGRRSPVIAHVEAGMRSFVRTMPEEINRVVTDRLSELLFCSSEAAVENLAAEGIVKGVHNVGDVMLDTLVYYVKRAREFSTVLERLESVRSGLRDEGFFVATVHRAENTDDPARLRAIMAGLGKLRRTVVFPAHPRVQKMLGEYGIEPGPNLLVIDPVGYLDMVALVSSAEAVFTDSGGLQKEAYILKVPCATLRAETEWIELVDAGWNVLVDTDGEAMLAVAEDVETIRRREHPDFYGDGEASDRIVQIIAASR